MEDRSPKIVRKPHRTANRYHAVVRGGAKDYYVYRGGVRVGRVSWDGESWVASLASDPGVLGTGRTRDAAVDAAVNQVGGWG